VSGVDARDGRRVLGAGGILGAFNAAGVLAAADVHVADTIGRLTGEDDETVRLAFAFAVRAPRLGHVCTDLAAVRDTVTVEGEDPVDLDVLPWPDRGPWLEAVGASPAVAVGADGPPDRPLRLVDGTLYLDRYWREERQVADDLLARAVAAVVDGGALDAGLDRLFGPGDPELQRRAAATAVRRRLAVVAGGPGTGKTTTVARILALLDLQAAATGRPPPRVALAAPTGKAAARLTEAVHREARDLPVDQQVAARLLALEASTLHRLLGWQPGTRIRYRHHRGNRLPHDVVIVDETSMVSLSMMARLLEAVRDGARLVLVGDPEQLASVEAGAVLGDVVGPAGGPGGPAVEGGIAEGIVVLREVHRYKAGIARLAEAIQSGDADAVMAVLHDGPADVRWLDVDVAGDGTAAALDPLRDDVLAAGTGVMAAARAGDGGAALRSLDGFRLLCAHRRGPYGVSRWAGQVERWLAAANPGYGTGGTWYLGRPLLVTQNDYGLHLFNGDTGVVVAAGDGLTAVFERRGAVVPVSPTVLAAVDTVHAMTIHKSQGSQFRSVAVLLPDAGSPLLTRELLYTAVTRAQERVTLIGGEAAVRAAVARPVARASGLRGALWR
jgi:exodeoxyribonuclease V alpha subunit